LPCIACDGFGVKTLAAMSAANRTCCSTISSKSRTAPLIEQIEAEGLYFCVHLKKPWWKQKLGELGYTLSLPAVPDRTRSKYLDCKHPQGIRLVPAPGVLGEIVSVLSNLSRWFSFIG
jgi:hypothetical protein